MMFAMLSVLHTVAVAAALPIYLYLLHLGIFLCFRRDDLSGIIMSCQNQLATLC